jgi:WD40 repeat protein
VWSESHFKGILDVAFHRGVSDAFATISKDCTVRVWDLNDYHVTWWARIDTPVGVEPTCLAWACGCLFSGWTDGRIRCHNVSSPSATKDLLWQIDGAHNNGVTAIAMSESEKFFVSGGEDGEIRLWDIKTREMVSHLKEHNSRVTGLALCSDHVHALSCSRDRSIFVWDLRQEKHVATNTQRMGGINAVALHPNNRNMVSVGQERKVTFWELNKADPVRLISPAHDGEAFCIAVSNNGKVLASGGTDDVVKLWDVATGELLAEGVGHSGTVSGLKFSPDDRQLVSVGEDSNALVWNVYMD